VQNIVRNRHNGIIVDLVASIPMALFLTVIRLDKVALGARMDILQVPFFLILSMFQE
jgi:hypothetical protein